MENEKVIPLANGSRDRKSESPDENAAAGETDLCLPCNNRQNVQPGMYDEVDSKKKLAASNNSVNKNRSESNFDKNKKIGARLEENLRRRTGLSHIGIIVAAIVVILLLICLIVIIALAASWPRTPHSQQFPVCTRSACLQASAQILPKMNASALPCDDFWSYSCGHWLKAHPIPPTRSRWSLADEREFKYYEQLRSLVMTLPYTKKIHSVIWKLHHMYASCMYLDNIESDGKRPLKRLITKIGGWSVLREFSVHDWDFKEVLVTLHAEYNVSPFFHIDVVPDPKEPSKAIVQITPSKLDLPDKSYYYRTPDSVFLPPFGDPRRANLGKVCVDLSNVTSLQNLFRLLGDTNVPKAYLNFLNDVVRRLEATGEDASTFSKEIFYLQRRIAEITRSSEELGHPFSSSKRDTIENLSQTASSIPLLDILRAMFPKAGIDTSTEVLVPASSYLNKISNIISSSDRSTMNDYVMWIFTSSYIPYLSKEFLSILNIYKEALTGVQEPIQRWEMCIGTLQKYMGFALAVMHSKTISNAEKEASRNKVSEMFDNVRDTIRDSLAKATWLEKDIQEHALKKINSMALQVGFPSHMMSDVYMDEYYSSLQINKNDLFQNIRNGMEFVQAVQRNWLSNPKEEYRWMAAMSESTATYIPLANKVVVPQQLLAPPFFHSQYPESLLYGGLGVQLSSAIVSAVLPWNVLYDGEGVLLTGNRTEINQTERAISPARSFIIHDIVTNGRADQILANRSALATINHISAVRQAYMALMKSLTGKPHVHQPGMENFESDQLFFVTYAQNTCSQSTHLQMVMDSTVSHSLNSSQLLLTTLKQLPEFTHTFSCPRASEYYSSNPYSKIL